MGKVETNFSAERAGQLAGLSSAMVNYLCRTAVLVPTGSRKRGRGQRRIYSFGDVVMLRVLARLLDAGISVLRLKIALRALRRYHSDITPSSLPAALLVTDGKSLYLRDRRGILEDLNSRQMAFAFVLELSQIQQEVIARCIDKKYGT
jgi:DNA-binding transcriptional MerR regulator